jgi:hypothetical protein
VAFQLLKRRSWKVVADRLLATPRPPPFEKTGMSLEAIERRFRVICLFMMHALFALLFGFCFAGFHAGIGAVLVIMFLETYVSFHSLQFIELFAAVIGALFGFLEGVRCYLSAAVKGAPREANGFSELRSNGGSGVVMAVPNQAGQAEDAPDVRSRE